MRSASGRSAGISTPLRVNVATTASLAEPNEQQGRAFEDESVCKLGLRQAIQQALAAEAGKRELVLDAEFAAPLHECACTEATIFLGPSRFT